MLAVSDTLYDLLPDPFIPAFAVATSWTSVNPTAPAQLHTKPLSNCQNLLSLSDTCTYLESELACAEHCPPAFLEVLQ
jgi:hypothetical protein